MDLRPLSRVLKIKVNQVDLKTPEKLTGFPIYMYKSLDKTSLNKSDIYTGNTAAVIAVKPYPPVFTGSKSLWKSRSSIHFSQLR